MAQKQKRSGSRQVSQGVDTTELGREHRVCRYCPMPGAWAGDAA